RSAQPTMHSCCAHHISARAASIWPAAKAGVKIEMHNFRRIDDVMHFSWDEYEQIHPVWPRLRTQHPTIVIPSSQKSRKNEEIPMLPDLAELLRSVPKSERSGWVVYPQAVEFTMKSQADWFMPSDADLAGLLPAYSNC